MTNLTITGAGMVPHLLGAMTMKRDLLTTRKVVESLVIT